MTFIFLFLVVQGRKGPSLALAATEFSRAAGPQLELPNNGGAERENEAMIKRALRFLPNLMICLQ
jgi:hypothetical protein